MTVIITDVPQTINGMLSKAIAGLTQIPYRFRKVDFNIDAVINSGGKAQLQIEAAAGDVQNQFNAGTFVYLVPNNNALRTGFYLIDAVTFPVANTLLLTSTDFIATSAGDLTNTLPAGYRFEVRIRDSAGEIANFDNPLIYVPNQAGISGLVDLSNAIITIMLANSFLSYEFDLEVRDAWNGAVEQTPQFTTLIQAVLGRKQQLKLGGALMWENLLRAGGGDVTTLWTTDFNKIVQDASGSGTAWSAFQSGFTVRLAGTTTQLSNIITTEAKGTILTNTLLHIEYNLRYQIPAYTSTGDLQTQIYGDRGDGTFDLLFTFTEATIIAATGSIVISRTYTAGIAAEQYVGMALRHNKINGDFTVDFIYDGLVSVPDDSLINMGPQYPIAKLLTKFKEPKVWRGWNRTVACLLDIEYASRTGAVNLAIQQDSMDINKVSLGATDEIFITGDLTSRVVIAKLVDNPATALTEYGRVYGRIQGSSTLSELLFYRIENECRNPVMLDWFNSAGGVDQHLFSISQTVTIEAEEGLIGETQINDNIEFVAKTKFRVTNREKERMVLTAEQLTKNDILAMADIKFSQSVRIYLSKDGVDFIQVIVVNTFSTSYNSNDSLHSFTVEVEFPDNWSFEEGKLY